MLTLGCTGEKSADKPATRAFTDSLGRTVELPVTIEKIAPTGSGAFLALAPLAPEKIAGLPSPLNEVEQKFLGEALSQKPVIGHFYGTHNFNKEVVATLGPDVIIDVGSVKPKSAGDMAKIQADTGIATIYLNGDFKDIAATYEILGELLGKQERAAELAAYIMHLNALQQQLMAKVQKKSVLWVTDTAKLAIVPEGSPHSLLINEMADNVAKDLKLGQRAVAEVSSEQLLLWQPEVILVNAGGNLAGGIWTNLAAVNNHEVYTIPETPFSWLGSPPSVNRFLGMLWLGKVLYPEQAEYNLEQEVKEYYRIFYHYELSSEEYRSIVGMEL